MGEIQNDFFKRKEAKGIEIPDCGDYDSKNFDNDATACGILDIESLQERHKHLFENLIVDSKKENPVATVAKRMEETFSKRELAFIMSKDVLTQAYNQSQKELNVVKEKSK